MVVNALVVVVVVVVVVVIVTMVKVFLYVIFSFQLPERAIFKIKQYNSTSHGVSEWQLEEAQVFWAKKEQSLALSILKHMIRKVGASCSEVHFFIG